MSTPTQKTSRSRRGKRRSHHKLAKLQVAFDSEGNPHLSHHATPVTGKYKGRNVIDVAKRVLRRSKKKV